MKKACAIWAAGIFILATFLVCVGVLYLANIEFGIISVAFPAPATVAQRYFTAVQAGDEKTVLKLTAAQGFCHDLTLDMAREHIARFASQEIRNVVVSADYWKDAPTDYSPARTQIGTIQFEYREVEGDEWQKGEIRFSILQSGWRYIICGFPG
ncbi:MAG: hypothetical protein KF753_23465 [Caldilineaceae bacterium]|nr:hypothetical protein [Caldilineaceae bacterium]